jgi:hypothetical protein
MSLVPFVYSVSAYDPNLDDRDHDYCDAPDCPNPCAYVFEGKRVSSDPFPVDGAIAGPQEAVQRTLHYCLMHAEKFAANEDLPLPT